MRESLTCSKYLRIWNQEHSGLLAKVNLDEGLSAEEKYALAQFTVALATGPSTWKYFAALPTMALINALLMYRDTNISFLGRSPGKRYDPRAAINVLLQVGADAIIDAATFNFGSALLHAADAAMTSPVEKDIANLRAAATQLERVFQLKAALNKLDAQVELVAGFLSTSEVAIQGSISDIERNGAIVTNSLKARGGLKPPQVK